MGDWGGRIFKGDHAYDYQAIIGDLLERELIYWTSPEKIDNSSTWITEILSVIEIIFLLEQYDFSNGAFLSEEKAVQRWRDEFFRVWDGEWQNKETSSYSYDVPEYRKEHRSAVVGMFDYLESVARFWADPSKVRTEAEPSQPEHPLPYFSIKHWRNRNDEEIVSLVGYSKTLFEHLVRDIVYWLSAEKRSEFNFDDLWTASDILGFLSERYECTPGINEHIVRTWRVTSVEIWKQFLGSDKIEWDETDITYQNIMQVFDRLEYLAKKYPPREW